MAHGNLPFSIPEEQNPVTNTNGGDAIGPDSDNASPSIDTANNETDERHMDIGYLESEECMPDTDGESYWD